MTLDSGRLYAFDLGPGALDALASPDPLPTTHPILGVLTVSELSLYWGDSHTNLHSHHLAGIDETVRYARQTLDFWPIAYYPQDTRVEPDYFNGFPVEKPHKKSLVGKNITGKSDLVSLAVIDENPLEDLNRLGAPSMVILDGKIIQIVD